MWAMMPMLRVFSSGYCGSTGRLSLRMLDGATQGKRGVEPSAPLFPSRLLPAVVRERLVGLRHLVSVFTLLHGGAPIVRGVEQLARQLLGHAPLGTPARRADQPPHAEGHAAVGPNLHRHLVRRATDAARLHLDGGLAVVDGGLEHLERVLLGSVLDA